MMRFTILVATALLLGAAPAAAPDGAPAAARTAEEALELAAALDALLADRYPSGRALGLRLDDGEPEVYSVLRKADRKIVSLSAFSFFIIHFLLLSVSVSVSVFLTNGTDTGTPYRYSASARMAVAISCSQRSPFASSLSLL
jgi:hypothetical protein